MSVRDITNLKSFAAKDGKKFKFTFQAWRGESKVVIKVEELGDDIEMSVDAIKNMIEGLQGIVEHVGEVKKIDKGIAPPPLRSVTGAPVFKNFDPKTTDESSDLPQAEPDVEEVVAVIPAFVASVEQQTTQEINDGKGTVFVGGYQRGQ